MLYVKGFRYEELLSFVPRDFMYQRGIAAPLVLDSWPWVKQLEGTMAQLQDDPNLEDYNVKSRVDDFVAAALNQARIKIGRRFLPFGTSTMSNLSQLKNP